MAQNGSKLSIKDIAGSASRDKRPASFLDEAVARSAGDSVDPAFKIRGMPPRYGSFPLPHQLTFQGLFGTHSKVYRVSDEALKNSRENARFMRNDPGVMECLEARQRATALLEWKVEPENPNSSEQKDLCDVLAKTLRRISRFTEYRRCLMEAIWYGRSAIQNRYGWNWIGETQVCMPLRSRNHPGWLPVHGDKLVFRYDDGENAPDEPPHQMGIRVTSKMGAGDLIYDRWQVETTGLGLAYFLRGYERNAFCVHKHMIEDAAHDNGLDAGSIHGVGIRSRIYWDWFQKQESLAFLMEYLERSAGGIEIWSYPAGDPNALNQAQEAAKARISGGHNVVFFPKPPGDDGHLYDVQVIEPGMSGIESLKDILNTYFGHRIKRYILGQTLSSEADATGLGSGVADLHLDTLLQIVQYDSRNLQETVTHELLNQIKDWSFPHARNINCNFVIKTEAADVNEELEAIHRAWEMGAKIKESEVMELVGASIPREGESVLQAPQYLQMEQEQAAGGAGGPVNIPKDGDGDGIAGDDDLQEYTPQSAEEISGMIMDNYYAGQADDEGEEGQLHYVNEDGEWIERQIPNFDTGDRTKDQGQKYHRGTLHLRDRLAQAVSETKPNPTQKEIDDGNYPKGKVWISGHEFAIETPKGVKRHGRTDEGEDWAVVMPAHYGYVRRKDDNDNEQIDAFISDELEIKKVFVIDQYKTSDPNVFDEHKVMIGFPHKKAATTTYRKSFSNKSPRHKIKALTWKEFTYWLAEGDHQKPILEQTFKPTGHRVNRMRIDDELMDY